MNVFWISISIALFLFAWRGWRLGLVRASISSGTLVAAGLLGWMVGEFALNSFGASLPWPPVYNRMVVAAGFALGAYLVVTILSGLLLKRTKDHESRLLRTVFGVGGALVGLLTGVLIAAAGFWLVTQNPNATLSTKPAETETSAPATLNSSYQTLEKLLRVTQSPAAMERFVSHPGVQSLVSHPKIVELTSNPDINEAALKRDYLALFSNPAVLKALSDPSLVKELQRIELDQALDDSLKSPLPEK